MCIRDRLKAGQPIELTQVEFQIMELFFRNPGTALVREKILKGVWGENYFGCLLYTSLSEIRKKPLAN